MKRKGNTPPWLIDVSGEYPAPSECEDRIRECIECGEEFDGWDPHLFSGELCFDCEEDEEERAATPPRGETSASVPSAGRPGDTPAPDARKA